MHYHSSKAHITRIYAYFLMVSTNPFLLRLCLGLEAANLLLGQRHSILLLLGRPEPELEICHLPLQLHDPGALRHSGHLQQKMQRGGMRVKEDTGEADRGEETWVLKREAYTRSSFDLSTVMWGRVATQSYNHLQSLHFIYWFLREVMIKNKQYSLIKDKQNPCG